MPTPTEIRQLLAQEAEANITLSEEELSLVADIAHLLTTLSDEALKLVIAKAQADIDAPDHLEAFRENILSATGLNTGTNTAAASALQETRRQFKIAMIALYATSLSIDAGFGNLTIRAAYLEACRVESVGEVALGLPPRDPVTGSTILGNS